MSLTPGKNEDVQYDRLLAHIVAVRENWESVVRIKDAIAADKIEMFLSEWPHFTPEDQIALLRTEGAGGIWWVPEYKKLREWGA